MVDEKSAAAVARAHKQFTWQAKAQQILRVYQWVLGDASKPSFAMPTPDLGECRKAKRPAPAIVRKGAAFG